MSLVDLSSGRQVNPVDVVESVAAVNGWPFERGAEDEITISIDGRWADYHASFTWMSEIEALHLACAFDLKVPESRRAEVRQLVSQVNEQLWVGHFDIWPKEGVVMHRHGLMLVGGAQPSGEQCAALLNNALSTCERYYQSFQFVLWAGKGAKEALEAATFETKGQA